MRDWRFRASTEDLLEWECPFLDERFPHRDNVWIIDGEHMNRNAADRCSAGQDRTSPLEVFRPPVHPGMEKPDEFSCVLICSSEVRALVPIAVKTGEGEGEVF